MLILGHSLLRAWVKSCMNDWMRRFYDVGGAAPEVGSGDVEALDEGAARVSTLLREFALLCLPSVLAHPLVKLLTNRWVLTWRIVLINSYLGAWQPVDHVIEGSAQRIHEDTQRFASGVQSVCVVLLDCVLTLCVFAPVLLELGSAIQPAPMTGSWLVLSCSGLAMGGVVVSVALGWRLIGLEVQNQRVEAALRKGLVLYEDQKPASSVVDADGVIDLSPGRAESAPVEGLRHVIGSLKDNYKRLYARFAAFSLWLGAYEQAVVLMPYILVAPLLYARTNRVTLGKVSQTSHAFGNVFNSLSVLSDRWIEVMEFLSVVQRLREWERVLGERAALVEPEEMCPTASVLVSRV